MTEVTTLPYKSIRELLSAHVGKPFTIVNPESWEESGVGHHITADWYPAKLAAIGDDFAVFVGHFQHGAGKHATKEPMEQYVPLACIKRITLMHSQRLVHL